LTDLSGSTDSLQNELDKNSQSGQVELELAQLKGEAAPGGALGAGGHTTANDPKAADTEGVAEGEVTSGDLFSLGDAGSAS
jgi:hypothetical protein